MMVGFWKSSVSIILKGHLFCHQLYPMPEGWSEFPLKPHPLLCVQQLCTHCQGYSFGASPHPISHSFPSDLLQTLSCCFCKRDHQAGHTLWQLSCFLNNHKQQLKTSPNTVLMSLLQRSHTRSWLLTCYRGGEVLWFFKLSPTRSLGEAIFSCGWVELPDTHCSNKGSWASFQPFSPGVSLDIP